MLGFGLLLAPPRPERLNTRYDVKSKVKFDSGEIVRKYREGVVSQIRQSVADLYERKRSGFYYTGQFSCDVSVGERLLFADTLLRTQQRVGLVMGSLAAKVINNPNLEEYASDSDLDVMILNPHSGLNPRPFEWNIDWFVTPNYQSARPTNSNVDVVYKIAKKPDVVFKHNQRTARLDDYVLISRRSGLKGAIGLLAGEIQDINAERREITPGLYFPAPAVLRKVAEYCNSVREKANLRKDDYSYLIPRREPEKFFAWPILGEDLIDVVPMV